MRIMLKACLFIAILSGSMAVQAGQYNDAVNLCFANSTTGKDRTDLARWIFMGMAAHPAISDLTTIPSEKLESMNKSVAALVTRLITKDCVAEMKKASQLEGTDTIKSAFSYLGTLAMQELMANPNVSSSFSNFSKYLDRDGLLEVLKIK